MIIDKGSLSIILGPLKLFVLEENPKKYLVKNLQCMLKLRNSTQKNILGNTI